MTDKQNIIANMYFCNKTHLDCKLPTSRPLFLGSYLQVKWLALGGKNVSDDNISNIACSKSYLLSKT